MQRPPPFVLTEPVWTTGVAPPGFTPAPQTPTNTYNSGAFGFPPGAGRVVRKVTHTIATAEQEYQAQLTQLPQAIENELTATRLDGPTNPVPPIEGIARELEVINRLAARKRAEFDNKTAIANSYYGYDPIGRPFPEVLKKGVTLEKPFHANSLGMLAWTKSYNAAYDARLLSQTIHSLEQRYGNLVTTLTALQAAEQARLAAEQARIRAEAEALAHAQEQARLAAQAEAKRVAEEQTRMAEAAEAQRLAAAKKAHEEAWAGRTFPVSASAAAAGPVFTVARGNLPLNPAIASAINATLRAAVAAVIDTIAAAAAPIVGGGIALFYPSELGNSDLYSLSVPLSELAPGNTDDLHAIAAAQGEVLLPVVIGSRTKTHNTEFVVTSANMASVPGVPVRLATLDPHGNFYRSPNATAPNLTWTPIVKPGNASTLLPAGVPNVTVYNGPSAVALDHRIDRHPELDRYRFGGFVTVFPVESGIPPIYTVFNSPYEGATTKGEYSGRDFNAEQAGWPTLDMKWEPAIASQEGANIVKLHTSKFLPSDANKVMIDRLDRILRGELEMTDTDRRFYTHEIREFERFKALGYGDTEMPDPDSPVWNNVHTATLEDFKLKDDPSLLYTPEALAAAAGQDERDYQRFLKEMWK